MPRQPGKPSRQSDMFRPASLPQPPASYYSGDQPNPTTRIPVWSVATHDPVARPV